MTTKKILKTFLSFLLFSLFSCDNQTYEREPIDELELSSSLIIESTIPSSFQISKQVSLSKSPFLQKNTLDEEKLEEVAKQLDSLVLIMKSRSIQANRVAAPITAGIVMIGLKSIINDLTNTIKSLPAEIRSQAEALLATANAVLAEYEKRLSDKLEYTLDRLDEAEKRLVEDTESLIAQMEKAANNLRSGLTDAAIVATGEADIAGYNIIYNLKRSKEPRLVYIIPKKYQIGIGEPVVKVRGNFLNFGDYPVMIGGKAAKIISKNNNEFVAKLPEEVLNKISNIETIKVAASPPIKKKNIFGFIRIVSGQVQSLSLQIVPKKTYNIYVKYYPTAMLPTTNSFSFSHYDSSDDCGIDRGSDRLWPLPTGWEVINFSLGITTANCGSSAGQAIQSGTNAVFVPGRLKGCGGGIFGCKGRGWIGYILNVNAKSYSEKPLEEIELTEIKDQSQKSFTFTYPSGKVPADNRGVKWNYNLIVRIIQGNTEKIVNISNVNPNSDGVKSRIGENGVLAVEINEDMSLIASN